MKRKKYQSGGFDPKQVSKSAVMPAIKQPTIEVFNPPKAQTGGNTPKPKSVRPAPRPKAPVRPAPRPAPRPKQAGPSKGRGRSGVVNAAIPAPERAPTNRRRTTAGPKPRSMVTPRPGVRPVPRPRGRVRRAEGGVTDFSSIFDMEKGK
jgi:hypothetical protein